LRDWAASARTIRAVIDRLAEEQPDAPLLLAPDSGALVTYAELRQTARSLAGELAAAGIRPGEVVSFMLGNGLSAAQLFLSAMYSGYVVSPVNLLAQDAQLEYVLAHSETRMVFAALGFADRLHGLLARTGNRALLRVTDVDDLALATNGVGSVPASPESATPALLMYTSGTTGMPKGVVLTHANLVAAGYAVSAALELTPADRVLSSLPLYHVNGLCIATISPLISGGSIVVPHRFSVSQWWPTIERFSPTWLNMVPTIVAYLLNGPDLTDGQQAACRAIRFGRCASAPLPPEHHRAFETRFGVSVIEAMGLTETASVAFANPLDPSARKYGSAGRPLGVSARVVARDGAVLAPGEAGEIELRGSNVMHGYLKAPELTAKDLHADGWLATGDLGYCDNDGFYFITGRLKELIIKGGENIAPREIDEALLKHPAVLEAAAVGVPDAGYGQEILACIVRRPGYACSEDELRAHCLRELGRYKTPKSLRFVTELPKGPSGKVQRLKLLELVG